MKKIIYSGLLLATLLSCTKESVYEPIDLTIYEAVDIWFQDARARGIEVNGDVEVQFVPLSPGFAGLAFGNTVQINSDYWKGNTTNLNTVYHELGHANGLGHDVTPIMSTHASPNTVMQNVDEYWNLIEETN